MPSTEQVIRQVVVREDDTVHLLRCDGCGMPSKVTFVGRPGELSLCGHHTLASLPALLSHGFAPELVQPEFTAQMPRPAYA